MRAVVITEPGPPDVLTVTDVDDPTPGPGEVVVSIAAAGVNRADLLQRQGRYPPPAGEPTWPGLECSGRITAVGSDSGIWRVGDAVTALLAGGGYAEQVAVPVGQLLPVPSGVDIELAAALPEAACTVWSNVFMAAGLSKGETLLVHGGGSGIGTMAIQLGKAAGASVIVTCGSSRKVQGCLDLGADIGINYRESDFVDEVQKVTSGCGADVILDVIGAKYLARNIQALASHGRLVVIGLQGGSKSELDLASLLSKRASIMASTLRSRPRAEKTAIVEAVIANVWPLVESGRVRPVVDRVLSWTAASEAHLLLESGENFGKLVLRVEHQ